MDFDEGVKRTVKWWEAHREGYAERRSEKTTSITEETR